MAIPGDLVRYDGAERVVVDVTEDGFAVLRTHDDLDLNNPVATAADALEVVGHLDSVPGWTEDEPGVWRQA